MQELDFNELHTLGFLLADWIEAHVDVPSGALAGDPLLLNGWQLETLVHHYRVKQHATVDRVKLASPFLYRRSIIVGPQKVGKSPFGAALCLAEGVGPSLFDGWAKGGEKYRCFDNGCGCGWEYEYLPGEAMGRLRTKSLIGLLAMSEEQTANVYEPMQTMVVNGPLADMIKVREGFLRLPNRGMIMPMPSNAKSRLGKPLTFALGDESGLYTKENGVLKTWQTTRRGVAGMQGRTVELTNPPDAAENSAAQIALEEKVADVYKYWRQPPKNLSYTNKADRSKIHKYVYSDAPWVDTDAIDAEASELVETDPMQAERFFGNRMVAGKGAYMTDEIWDKTRAPRNVPPDTPVCLGFDGSGNNDWTALRAETLDGYRFTPTYGPDARPTYWNPAEWADRVPRSEVDAAVRSIFERYNVARFYIDPHLWETQTDAWAKDFGDKVVVQWPTNRITRMYDALVRYKEDTIEQVTTHDGDPTMTLHALAARKKAQPGDKYTLEKPSEHQKIDLLMADVLAHEAASDARADGWEPEPDSPFAFFDF